MHDTFLIQRLYHELLRLCMEQQFARLTAVHLVVNPDSHVSESLMQAYFRDQGCSLAGAWTVFRIERQEVGKLQAIIKSVEGEVRDA